MIRRSVIAIGLVAMAVFMAAIARELSAPREELSPPGCRVCHQTLELYDDRRSPVMRWRCPSCRRIETIWPAEWQGPRPADRQPRSDEWLQAHGIHVR